MRRWNDSGSPATAAVVVLVALALAIPACGRKQGDMPPKVLPESTTGQTTASPPAGTTPDRSPEPVDPPPLATLDADSTGIDRPVRDGLTLLREQQAQETPAVPVAEALALRNTSSAINRQILSTLGRLPDDGAADLSARIDRHVAGDLGSTNPIMISTTAEFDILGLTGFGLFSFGRDLEPFASAETVVSWQTSADGLLDKVVLRDDLVWSDALVMP